MRDQLDALLDSALAQAARRKVKPMPTNADRLDKIKESFHSIFTNPENWLPGRAIALIHQASNGNKTLLGAFREYTHKRSAARKLCRSMQPISIDSEEIVTGDWWLKQHDALHWPENPEHIETREFAFDIELSELQVFAKAAPIRIRLKAGWIQRVELVEQTQFASPTNKIFIHFPAGLDILEGMSFENKMSLRGRLGSS